MNTKVKQVRSGFTLVEIMIILTIISILAAIILSVFSRVREKGRSAVCQSNLKQIAISFQQYVKDNDSQYPGAGARDSNGAETSESRESWASYLAPYIRSTQIFICPTRQTYNGSSRIDYDYNILRLTNWSGRLTKGRNEAAVVDTSKIWLNTDEQTLDGHTGEGACGGWWWPTWGGVIHSGGANYSFADGHVKWLTQQQINTIECDLGNPST